MIVIPLEPSHALRQLGVVGQDILLSFPPIKRLGTAVRRDRAEEPSAHALSADRAERALQYIAANLGEVVSLPMIADAAHVSVFHFARLFRNSTDLSAMEFVQLTRVALAKRMLERGDVPVARLALALGFYDQSHFCRHFRRFMGCAPRTYRKQLRGGLVDAAIPA